MNATTHLIDGNHGEGGAVLVGAMIPGGADKLFRHADKLIKPLDEILGTIPAGRADDAIDFSKNPPPRDALPDLHAFGNKTTKPRAPRPGKDIDVDTNGMVHPTDPPTGASTFGDIDQAPLNGHYHVLPAGTKLPEGLKITPDGVDVGGTHLPTHHTISPITPMSFDEFVELFETLPWEYGGKK